MPRLFNNASRNHISLYLPTLIYNMYEFMSINTYTCVYVYVIVTERQRVGEERELIHLD